VLSTASNDLVAAGAKFHSVSLSIERFRNWASQEAGIYLPSADEYIIIQQMEIEIERNKDYI